MNRSIISTARHRKNYSVDPLQTTHLVKNSSLPKLRLPKSQTMELGVDASLNLVLAEFSTPKNSKYTPSTTRNYYPTPIFDSSSFGLTSVPRTSQQLVEENTLRKNKAEILIYELKKIDLSPGALAQENQKEDVNLLERKRRKKIEVQKKVFSLFEQVLSLSQLKYEIAFGITSDSFLDIDGVTDNFDLIEPMKDLAPLIARFPYTFFRKLRIPTITFCDDVFFHKANVMAFCENRILAKSLFPIKRLDTPEKLTNHFMQIIFYHLRSATTNFDTRLEKVEQERPRMNSTMMLLRFTDNKLKLKKKGGVEREWITLKALLLNPRETLSSNNENLKAKAFVFKSFLEELDPEGINEKWWAKLRSIVFPPPIRPAYNRLVGFQ